MEFVIKGPPSQGAPTISQWTFHQPFLLQAMSLESGFPYANYPPQNGSTSVREPPRKPPNGLVSRQISIIPKRE